MTAFTISFQQSESRTSLKQLSERLELLTMDNLYGAQRSGIWFNGSNMVLSLLSRQEETTQHQYNCQNCATDIWSQIFCGSVHAAVMCSAPNWVGSRLYLMDFVLLLHTMHLFIQTTTNKSDDRRLKPRQHFHRHALTLSSWLCQLPLLELQGKE